MSGIQQFVAAIGALQGFLLFGLLVTDRRVTHASRLLGVICLVLALMFCLALLLASQIDGSVLFVTGLLFYLPACVGGLIYLYCRNALANRRLRHRDWLHLTPLLICYLLAIDFVFLHPMPLAKWITGTPLESWRIALSEFVLVGQGLCYIPFSIWMIVQFRNRAQQALASFNPAVFRWLLWFTTALLIAWILKAIFALTDVASPYAYSFAADVLLVAIIYVIAVVQWRFPQLFTIEQFDEVAETTSEPKPSSPGLDDGSKIQLYETIVETVESQRLYRNSDLTLSALAEATGLSGHHVSEVLNQYAGKNFYEFINGYRVVYVQNQLREHHDAKVLDIAMEAGFASKSTFNAVFKQSTGQTPTQFRRTLTPTNV